MTDQVNWGQIPIVLNWGQIPIVLSAESEGWKMKLFSALVNKLSPKRDPAVLYVIIDELPNPRNWGTVDFIAGNQLIFSEDIDLAAPNTDAIEALIGQYWQEIQSSGYQRIQYKNVSDWVQKKVDAKLASGRR
jgi:hypothetical protein